jgi:hypothetical protein
VLEIGRLYAGVVECHASPRTLDALTAPAGVHLCRVAPDELLLLAAPSRTDELLRRATAQLVVAEPGALVVDQSDGWAIFRLPGNLPGHLPDEGMLALSQLALFAMPARRPSFVQGAVAGGAAKLLLLPGFVLLLVPYALRDHVARRLREVGAGFAVQLADDESPYLPSVEGRP